MRIPATRAFLVVAAVAVGTEGTPSDQDQEDHTCPVDEQDNGHRSSTTDVRHTRVRYTHS